jgi:hypothetical protein
MKNARQVNKSESWDDAEVLRLHGQLKVRF